MKHIPVTYLASSVWLSHIRRLICLPASVRSVPGLRMKRVLDFVNDQELILNRFERLLRNAHGKRMMIPASLT
jgi:hypothetical protein